MKKFTIGPNDAGQRLDRWLTKAVPLLPAPLAQKYIRLKRVKRNGRGAKRDARLEPGDVLQLYISDEFFDAPSPDNAFLRVDKPRLDILYEDEHLLLLNNPIAGNVAATMLLKDMVIDKVNRTVTVQNLPVELTGKEFDLLVFLASNKGRVFTKKQIYTQVWAEEYAFDDSNIMSFISKLRKKIEPNPEHPFYIQTVRGVGYRFNKEA